MYNVFRSEGSRNFTGRSTQDRLAGLRIREHQTVHMGVPDRAERKVRAELTCPREFRIIESGSSAMAIVDKTCAIG